MSGEKEAPAVAVARAHVEAWSDHDYETARASLAPDVHVTATTVDPTPPKVDLTGVDAYMRGLEEFARGVLPGTTRVIAGYGDDQRALLHVSSRVKFGADAPELTLHGSRLYPLDENRKIKDEQVIFFVLPD